MSLDMTMATRAATFDSTAARIEADAAPAVRFWPRHFFVAATACGVLLSSALGVLLFLR